MSEPHTCVHTLISSVGSSDIIDKMRFRDKNLKKKVVDNVDRYVRVSCNDTSCSVAMTILGPEYITNHSKPILVIWLYKF